MNYKIFLLYIIIFLLIILSFILINCFVIKNKEHFCKIPDIDSQGGENDKKVFLDDYLPQTNIMTSSCNKYWKDWPLEFNNSNVENNPIVINSDQLSLPKEKQFADNSEKFGLIDFEELSKIISDKLEYDILDISKELLIDPITKNNLKYKYELDYIYQSLNKSTYINRWQQYNTSIEIEFNYNEIKSPIEEINILNLYFKNKIDTMQKNLLSNKKLLLYGLLLFQIFKYKIININYINNDPDLPIYIIEISLFRDSDLYLNTFSYIGLIRYEKPLIINVNYIGRNATDNILLSEGYDPNYIKENIIDKNFSNDFLINKNPDAISNLTEKYQDSFKLKNQYGCFNINYNPKNKNDSFVLPYLSREMCESSFDPYGKSKSVGIFDTPCKKNEDCPFYKINKNYENDFGKCQGNGYCELPMNMVGLGYRYFTNNNKPLCYNCKSKDKFELYDTMDFCCDEQENKEKYSFLKSPDYAFKSDFLDRINYFNKLNFEKQNDKKEL